MKWRARLKTSTNGWWKENKNACHQAKRQTKKEDEQIKINWTVRLKNKVWLATMISFLISTVYQWLGYFDIARW